MNNRSHLNGTTKGRSRIIQCILHIIRYDYISYVRDGDNIYVLKYRFLDVSSQESPKKQRLSAEAPQKPPRQLVAMPNLCDVELGFFR